MEIYETNGGITAILAYMQMHRRYVNLNDPHYNDALIIMDSQPSAARQASSKAKIPPSLPSLRHI